MKRLSGRNSNQAMTLIEVLVVILIATVVMVMILPRRNNPDRARIYHCLNNVKQIDLGFIMYSDDNHGKFPIQTSTTNGGTMDFLEHNQTFPHFQKLSGYIRYMPVFVCPTDKKRPAANDYEHLTDTNLSYFLNADVSTNNSATSIMAGERHLAVNGQPVHHGTLTLVVNQNVTWTRELHPNLGTLGFADGHTEISRATNVTSNFRQQGLATVRLSIP